MSDPSGRKGKSKGESPSKSGTSSESSLERWDPDEVEGRRYPTSMARFSGYHNEYIPSGTALKQMTQQALASSSTAATATNPRDVQTSYNTSSTSQALRPSDEVRYDEETGEWHFPEHGSSETGTRPPSNKRRKNRRRGMLDGLNAPIKTRGGKKTQEGKFRLVLCEQGRCKPAEERQAPEGSTA